MSEQYGFIYQWTNKINGKKYIGSHYGTVDDGYTGSGKIFRRAIEKYGIENFEREILEYVHDSKKVLEEREEYYLKFNDVENDPMFYNIKNEAGGGWNWVNYGEGNEERKKKISEAAKKRLSNPENHPRGNLGKHHTEETKIRVSNSVRKTLIQNGQTKRIHKYSLDGAYLETFESLASAARAVGTAASNLMGACDGRFNQIKKFRWSYEKVEKLEGEISARSVRGKKKVKTPDGMFNSVMEAVRFYGFPSSNYVSDKCASNEYPEWEYVLG